MSSMCRPLTNGADGCNYGMEALMWAYVRLWLLLNMSIGEDSPKFDY